MFITLEKCRSFSISLCIEFFFHYLSIFKPFYKKYTSIRYWKYTNLRPWSGHVVPYKVHLSLFGTDFSCQQWNLRRRSWRWWIWIWNWLSSSILMRDIISSELTADRFSVSKGTIHVAKENRDLICAKKLHLHQLIHEQLVYVKRGCWGCRAQQALAL